MSSQEIFLRIRSLDLGSTGIPVLWNSGTGTVLEFPMISNRTLRVISSRELILILILILNCSNEPRASKMASDWPISRPASKMASDWPIWRPCMRIRSLDLGTGSRIPDPAMKLVGIPGVSRTCTSHRP